MTDPSKIIPSFLMWALAIAMGLILFSMAMSFEGDQTVRLNGELHQKYINDDGEYMLTINDTTRGMVYVEVNEVVFYNVGVGQRIWISAHEGDIQEVKP